MNTATKLKNLDPFFDAIKAGLGDLVDGEHFFDMLADDMTYEFRYTFPGLPEKITGLKEVMELFEACAEAEILDRYSGLVVHQTLESSIVILEYEVHGKSAKGKIYDNRFASIITINGRKIVYWRDYCDSLGAMNALGGN